MNIRHRLLENPGFDFRNNIFYQYGLESGSTFEKEYLALRKRENRVYPDEVVKTLPGTVAHPEWNKEWKQRRDTLRRLLRYLKDKKGAAILELGCGNGWLCNHLASLTGAEVLGMDVNETELLQAARVFKEISNLSFAYADILSCKDPYSKFDYIILSASIQYFGDPERLLSRLLSMLEENGEVHVVDSPFYAPDRVAEARKSTERYFAETGFPEMTRYYHHHPWQAIESFNPEIRYNPTGLFQKISVKFFAASPFPWLCIRKNSNRAGKIIPRRLDSNL